MEFAVRVDGLEGNPRWVLAVAGNRVLIAHDGGTLRWHPMKTCRFVTAHTPERPTPVMVVQPKSPLVLPPTKGMPG
jgi:hypothetical protein